jgi:purine-cytosine permease-like protein
MKEFLIFYGVGIIIVAGLMELYKQGTEKKKGKIIALSIILSLISTASVFFGLEHIGNYYTFPLWLLGTWYLQKVIDMNFIRRVVKAYIAKKEKEML